jgi:hypothetical protein
MLQRRRVEGGIIEDIEGRLRLRGARVDIPRYMVGKGVRSIKCYPAPLDTGGVSIVLFQSVLLVKGTE